MIPSKILESCSEVPPGTKLPHRPAAGLVLMKLIAGFIFEAPGTKTRCCLRKAYQLLGQVKQTSCWDGRAD